MSATFKCICGTAFTVEGQIRWNGCKGVWHTGRKYLGTNHIRCPKCSRTQNHKSKIK